MTKTCRFLVAMALCGVGGCLPLQAKWAATDNPRLAVAFAEQGAGRPQVALDAAEALLASGALTRLDRVHALDLEGMCYEDVGEPDKAVHALETAAQLLGPGDGAEMAAVLDNLGRIYDGEGNRAAAERVFAQAARLAAAAGDHTTLALIANNQAAAALRENDTKAAQRFLKVSDREAKAGNLAVDDRAAQLSIHGWLAMQRGDAEAGVEAYMQAVALWKGAHGEKHPATAYGMVLLGQAEAAAGQPNEGAHLMREGLAWLAATVGEKSPHYASGELAYAKLLERAGDTAAAAPLRADAEATLGVRCRDCTVSVLGLR